MVEYKYDSWGNHAVLDANGADIASATHIGNLNPFRYRGYYYDEETGLYYLNSRYYDPETGRFISPDDTFFLHLECVNGLNLFAYCINNPIMRLDKNGNEWWEFWKWDWAKIGMIFTSVVEVVGGVALIVTGIGGPLGMTLIGMGSGSLINGFLNESNNGSFLAGWTGGQVSGLLAGVVPYVGAAIGAFAGSVVADCIDYGWYNVNWGKAGLSALLALVFDIVPQTIMATMGKEFYHSVEMQLLLSYRGGFIGLINGIIDNNYDKLRG